MKRENGAGRIEVAREDNVITVQASFVDEFTLLLKPDELNLEESLIVVVNGRKVFEGLVAQDTATLLKWVEQDLDRTMLFTAELNIVVPEN